MKKRLSYVAFALGSASAKAWAALKHACSMAMAEQLDNYRPEAHYMRGPGPKWRAKNAKAAVRR
jgi:hypothetical protein